MLCDEVLAQVLNEVGIKIEGYWPKFNGEKASSLTFDHKHWCEAIVTLHHLGEEDFDLMHEFESIRQLPTTPLTFKELFDFLEPLLGHQVQDWSNMSKDIALKRKGNAGKSFTSCFSACLEDRNCVQWERFGDTCLLSHKIRLGHKQLPDGDKRWISGWLRDRVESFRSTQSECHEGAHIVHPNP